MSFWNNKWARNDTDNSDIQKAKSSDIEGVLGGLDPIGRRNIGLAPVNAGNAQAGSSDYHAMLLTGNIGRSVEMTGGVGSSEVVTLLDVEGPDDSAQLMTVTLDMPGQVGLNPFSGTPMTPPTFVDPFAWHTDNCRAKIEFGNGGFQSTAFVDFGRGVSFTVPASFVRVTASRVGLPGILAKLTVGAHIAYGSLGHARGAQPTISQTITVPAGANAQFILPPFAIAVTPQIVAGAGVTLTGEFNDGGGLGTLSTTQISIGMPRTIPIPAGAIDMRVFNATGADVVATLVYQLGL